MTLSNTGGHAVARARRRAILAGAFVFLVGCRPSVPLAPASTRPTPTPSSNQAAFLDTVQRRTFDWFWETTPARNGLVPDRWPSKSFSSIAAVGFGLTAYPIGVERGWITRDQARARVLTTLRFFWEAPQGDASAGVIGNHGFFYHFLDMETGYRFEHVELSTIDTGLLLGGVLLCREYFDRADTGETRIRALADSIFFRVDWAWFRNGAASLSMGWHPPNDPGADRGFLSNRWIGYNEAMLLYAMAVGSPTHPIDPSSWQAWTSGYTWGRFQGEEFVQFAPLFGHQYSHVWIDFRGIRDAYMRGKGIDYFENSRRATLSQRAYAAANPNGWDYSGEVWGLTASDGALDTTMVVNGRSRIFHTYWARGASIEEVPDDGTIAPTAAGGSVAFAPEIAVPALLAMRQRYGSDVFGRYGFLDAFNPSLRDPAVPVRQGRIVPGKGWFDTDYLGIDQGPILAMIENYRTELVWRLMRKNPYVVRGLCRIGFSGGWLTGRCE